MDAILESTEREDSDYFAEARDVPDALLREAIAELFRNTGFACLPSAALTVMQPASGERPGTTIGTLTVFRGGRLQWTDGAMGGLAQDWQTPHLYGDEHTALELWSRLRAGDIAAIRARHWQAGQTRLCPICGADLSNLDWPRRAPAATWGSDPSPPFDVPPYATCPCCKVTFGVDWIGMTYGDMRERWIDRACPWWRAARVTGLSPAEEAIRRNLLKTPTDYPLSSYPAGDDRAG